jgi:hypothetical protein
VLRRKSGSNSEEVSREWRRLHREELRKLYASPNIRVIKSRKMRGVDHVARMGQMKNSYTILVEKPEGKTPLKRPWYRWEDNIRIDARERRWNVVGWIHLVRTGTSGGFL